jgi:hypothetical protein
MASSALVFLAIMLLVALVVSLLQREVEVEELPLRTLDDYSEAVDPGEGVDAPAAEKIEIRKIGIVRVVPLDLDTSRPLSAVRCLVGETAFYPQPSDRVEFHVPASSLAVDGSTISFEVASHVGTETFEIGFPVDFRDEAEGIALAMLPFYSQIQLAFTNIESSDTERVLVSAIPLPDAPARDTPLHNAELGDLERQFLPDRFYNRHVTSAKDFAGLPPSEIEFNRTLQSYVITSQLAGSVLLRGSLACRLPVHSVVVVGRGEVTHVQLSIWT